MQSSGRRCSGRIWAERSDLRGRATSLGILGVVCRELGRLDKAMACHEESLSISRELGDLRTEALSLNDLGVLHAGLGHPAEALGCMRESLALFRQIGYGTRQMRTLRDLGDALLAAGDRRQARAAWQEALEISRTLETPGNKELITRLGTPPSITSTTDDRCNPPGKHGGIADVLRPSASNSAFLESGE